MGRFLFNKPETTFHYVNQVIRVLEATGLHVHCVPLLAFQRFMAKQILASPLLSILQDLRIHRLLNLLGYAEEAQELFASISLAKLKLSEHEKQTLLAKTNNSKVVKVQKKTIDLHEQQIPKLLLISENQPHKAWFGIAKELYFLGSFALAKELLAETYRHAEVLEEKELMGEIFLYQGLIAY